ncbi:MAG: hypothetical protein HPY53_16970 [Brevinematales bacterium]|nr:hypothetical protein [Brevinematales bacterium]
MRKLNAGVLSVLLLLIFAVVYPWKGHVTYVVDGDTYYVLSNYSDNDPAAAVKYKIRLYLMNCPEMGTPEGLEAKIWVSNLITGKDVELESLYLDKYGRTVAIVWIASNVSLGDLITNNGLGVVMEQYKIKGK